MNTLSTIPPRRLGRQGNTLVMVLLAIALLSVIASNLMWSATTRYHTTYQSASWQEALVAAEAGVNLAMVELRKRVKAGNNAAFQPPWLAGNPTVPAGPPADKRLLGGAIDPTRARAYYDADTDPGMNKAISMTPSYPENGHALPLTALATHGGEGNSQMWTRVYIDVPGSLPSPSTGGANFATRPTATIDDFMNEQSDLAGYDSRTYWWYRVRAMGITGVSGPPRPSSDHRDNVLRRFSFFTDWRSNLPVNNFGPQVSRVVEAVVKPNTGFRNAIMADMRIDLNDQSVLVDSYNSSYGLYGSTYTQNGNKATNIGNMGNIATNGTLINAGGATVKGDAMTDDGTVKDADNVSGDRRTDFYQELTKVPAPAPGSPNNFALDGLSLNGSTKSGSSGSIYFDGNGNYVISGSADKNAPTRVYLNGIDLTHKQSTIKLGGAADNSSTYVKLIVNGDIRVNSDATPTGNSAIILDQGVHAIIYVTGNVQLRGAGIANAAKISGNLLINGVQPPSANSTPPTIQIQSTQDFQGIIYAPDHDVTLALQATVNTSSGGKDNNKDLIENLNHQIEDLQHSIKDNQKKIADLLKDTQENPLRAAVNNARIAVLQTTIATTNTQVAALQAQITSLKSNILPDDPSQGTDHANGYNGIYGAFVGRTITVGSKTHVHYDESLRQAGPVNHYTITNWLEDNASHASN